MAKPKLPKPTLTVSPALTTEGRNKQMFEAWIEECVGMQEAFIEGLLVNLPSLKGKDG